MERKRVRYKGSDIDCNSQDKLISENDYALTTKEREIEDSHREVQTSEKKDLQQSCILDPSFSIDCSSSDSAESSSSNEWLNCEDETEEEEEEKPQSLPSVSFMQNHKFVLTDFIPARKNACSDELSGREATQSYQSSKTLPVHETDKSLKKSEVNNLYIEKTLRNKLQLSKKRMEPYIDENFLTGNSQALLSSISKLYIGGYNKLASLAGYVSESESSSVYSDYSTKKAIKSILKRECKNQKDHNPKKKVRFDLNLRSIRDVSSVIRKLPIANNKKASDENLNNGIKIESKPIELGRPFTFNCSERNSKEEIVERNVEVYREQSDDQNYFTIKESFSNTKQTDKTRKTAFRLSRECEKVSLESLGTEKLLEESPKLLDSLKTRNQVSVFQSNLNSNNLFSDSIDLSPSPAPVTQSDQLETDSEKATSSEANKVKIESLIELGLENQSPITDSDYSLFIKDLVNGSGDKLAKFLINLSSEISSKSGEEKIENALMTVGFLKEKNESYDTSKEMHKETLNGNFKLVESNMDSNKYEKDIESMKEIHRNGLNSANKKNGRHPVINNRRSVSEVDIRSIEPMKSYCNSYWEKKLHNSRIDQSFIKATNDDSMWHGSSKNHPNTNSEVMGRLCEIMAELKQNVDKICRKESTIRIENAQIWLKENKQVEKSMSTKETYSQTTETISVYAEGHSGKQTEDKTEILFFSNPENDKINIKLNDKSTKNSFMSGSRETNKTEREFNEIEERKRYFEENRHIPFNVVFNDKTHLPTLKKGKYEVEIFEKMDGQVIHDTHFKNIMKKLTGNLNSIKLNGFHSYNKPRNIKDSSFKSSHSRTNKQDKSLPSLLSSLRNKLLKLKINLPVKKTNSQYFNSEHWEGSDQISVLKSFDQDDKEDEVFSATICKDRLAQYNNIGSFNIEHMFSKCSRQLMEMYEHNVVKTRYPNGMVYFGPLTRMPEPAVCERRSEESENCPCSKLAGCHQYVFNKHTKHTVKASMSTNLSHQPEDGVSLEAFSETEEEFYQLLNEMDKV